MSHMTIRLSQWLNILMGKTAWVQRSRRDREAACLRPDTDTDTAKGDCEITKA